MTIPQLLDFLFFLMFLFSEYCYEGYKESASPVVLNFGQSLEYGIMREGKVELILSDRGITCIQERLQITDVSLVICTLDVQNTLM